jgi:tRNA-dihydrouridine synthase C
MKMPRLMLAPMEGLVDDVMRDTLTRVVGPAAYAHAVTEFIRVTESVLPARCFTRVSPELLNGGCTASGTSVRVQLLGSDPEYMAANAAQLATLAPPGIDLNFGCPAPTVNRHRGGAVLLDEPDLLHDIAKAVRAAVPASIPYTAKMRLGVRDGSRARECAQALAEGGVEEITIHARTKLDGYRPPAHWSAIAAVAEAVRIPVIANGEVWTVADWARCRSESGASDVMLGRGAVADPLLVTRIQRVAAGADETRPEDDWAQLLPHVAHYWRSVRAKVEPRHAPGRLKQWLHLLERNYPQAARLMADVRLLRVADEVEARLRQHGVPLANREDAPEPAVERARAMAPA